MKKNCLKKRIIKGMISSVFVIVLISVSFQSCQKDEILLNDNFENKAIQSNQSKSASISGIDVLIDKIEDYESEGELDSKLAKVFIKELENVKKSLDKENEKAAENLLQSLIYQLEGLMKAGTIETSIGEGLISQLESMVGENPTFTDTRDGHVYKTVTIGNQTWMAENLAYNSTASLVYEDNEENANIYGRLYPWNDVKYGDICPEGWHVPTQKEWIELANYIGESYVDNYSDYPYPYINTNDVIISSVGSAMKTTGTDATNESGFNGLLGGLYTPYSSYSYQALGDYGIWWTSDLYDSNSGIITVLKIFSPDLEIKITSLDYYYSVRLIKNDLTTIN